MIREVDTGDLKEKIEGWKEQLKNRFVESEVERAKRRAGRFVDEYVPEYFRGILLSSERLREVFFLYIAIYLLKKEGYELSYLNRHPIAETGAKMRLIGSLYRLLYFFEEVEKSAISTLENELLQYDDLPKDIIRKIQITANMLTTLYLQHDPRKGGDPAELYKIIDNYIRRHWLK